MATCATASGISRGTDGIDSAVRIRHQAHHRPAPKRSLIHEAQHGTIGKRRADSFVFTHWLGFAVHKHLAAHP